MDLRSRMLTLAGYPLIVFLRRAHPIMKIWRRIYYSARANAQLGSTDMTLQCDGPVTILGTRRITIGSRCRIGGQTELETMDEGVIRIEANVRINRGCTFVAYDSISIGEYSMIGEFCSLRDADHGLGTDRPIRLQPHTAEAITIGNDVWIGRGCCLLGGSRIGTGAVVGANSVVTGTIPSFSIAAGTPAKIIRQRT